jgi:hypothetical protein
VQDGRFGYAQLLLHHSSYGDLVRLFDRVSIRPLGMDALAEAGHMPQPLLVSLQGLTRNGLWRCIGHLPAEPPSPLRLRYSHSYLPFGGEPEERCEDWVILTQREEGEERKPVGKLPAELKAYPLTWCFSHQTVVKFLEMAYPLTGDSAPLAKGQGPIEVQREEEGEPGSECMATLHLLLSQSFHEAIFSLGFEISSAVEESQLGRVVAEESQPDEYLVVVETVCGLSQLGPVLEPVVRRYRDVLRGAFVETDARNPERYDISLLDPQ